MNKAEIAAQALADLMNTEGLVTDPDDRRRIYEALGVIDDKYVPLLDALNAIEGID